MSAGNNFDNSAHRRNKNYSKGILIARVLWALAWPLYRFSPRHLYFWRNIILRAFGAKIGKQVRIYPSAHVFYPWNLEVGDHTTIGWSAEIYNLGKIAIGSHVLISHRVHLCAGTHDYTKLNLPLLTPPIEIASSTWICADAFIGPGVKVGQNSIIGARAVVIKDVPERSVMAGNPARLIRNL